MPEYIELYLEFKYKTDNAILVSDDENQYWLPLSQIECEYEVEDLKRNEELLISIPVWLAEEKGLI